MRESNVKVTLSLSRRSVDFFKREGSKRRVPYQRMIRALVDAYVEREKRSTRLFYAYRQPRAQIA